MFKKVIDFFKNNYLIILLSILIIIITIFIFNGSVKNFDEKVLIFFARFRGKILNRFMILISEFGSWYFISLITIISLLLIDSKYEKLLLVINSLGIFFINTFIKLIFQRIRPLKFMIINQKGYSFPSGHSMISIAFYGCLYLMINKYIKNKTKRVILKTILIILMVLIPISRIYLGVHYFTDVVTGILLSAIILLLEKKYFKLI